MSIPIFRTASRAARHTGARAARLWRLVRRRWAMWQHPSSGRHR